MKKIPLPDLNPYAKKLGVDVSIINKALMKKRTGVSSIKKNKKLDLEIEQQKKKVSKISSQQTEGEKAREQKTTEYEKAVKALESLCLKRLSQSNIFEAAEQAWRISPEASVLEELSIIKMAKLSKTRGEIRQTAKIQVPDDDEIVEAYVSEIKNLFYRNT
jgi:hypothetical protein